MKKIAIAALSLVTTVLVAGPASAQEYPPGGATCGVSSTVVPPGGSLTVGCDNLLPGSPFTIEFLSPEVLATGTVDADGSFSETVSIPSDARPGDHLIRVRGTDADGDPVSIEIPITVPGPGAEGVAFTGANITVGMLILAGLIVAGSAALVAGRRRANI